MSHTRKILSISDKGAENMIFRLFFGVYDEENLKAGKITNFKNREYRTQKEVADAIYDASNERHSVTQGALSKIFSDLEGVVLEYNGEKCKIGKVSGVYKALPIKKFTNEAKDELYLLDAFEENEIFFNNASKTTHSTLFAFKLNDCNTERAITLLKAILINSCFEIFTWADVLLIFLNANGSSFNEDAAWLENYFSRKATRIKELKKDEEERKKQEQEARKKRKEEQQSQKKQAQKEET